MLSATVVAQDVDVQNVTLDNPPATSCTNTFVTATGMLSAANYIYDGAQVSVNGSNISISVNYLAGIVILPAFMPFTQQIDLGQLPAGTYTVTVSGTLNGAPQATSAQTGFTVVSCCGVSASWQGSGSALCLGQTAQFVNSSTGATSVEWVVDGGPAIVADTLTLTPTIASNVLIQLIASDSSCSDTNNATLAVYALPTPNLGPDGPLCDGDSLVLDPGTYVGYQWNDGALTATQTALDSGLYSVTVTDANGCMAADSLHITGTLPVTFVLINGDEEYVCPGFSATLDCGVENATYLWSNGSTSQFVTGQAGTYICTVTLPGECPGVDTATIYETAIDTLDLGPDTVACFEYLLAPEGLYDTYYWDGGETSETLLVTQSGNYFLDIADYNGCEQYDGVYVTIIGDAVSLGPDTTMCANQNNQLLAPPAYGQYLWSSGETDFFVDLPMGFEADSTYTWWISATDTSGCASSDTIAVTFEVCNGMEELSEGAFSIAPNPTTDMVRLQFNEPVSGSLEVVVVSAVGQVVATKRVSAGATLVELDVQQLAPGVYTVRLAGSTSHAAMHFIKQ